MWRNLFFKPVLLSFALGLFVGPVFVDAQATEFNIQEQISAEVLEVVNEREKEITGTGAVAIVQEVRVTLLEGERAGEVVRFENEMVLLEPGEKIYVNRTVTADGQEYISYADHERRPVLIVIAVLFMLMLLVFSGWQGLRALISLAGSIAAIFFLLVPALLAGYNPVLSSVVIAGAVLAMVLFGTHGITPRSIIAFAGTFGAVAITGLIAWISAGAMNLSGFSSDASVYLNFATKGSLDLSGLLLGGIIIGILGVLDDVSITQASVVQQLKSANPAFGFTDLYKRAIKVGRDHIGSLVNTLALAYVGVSLPLILFYSETNSPLWQTLNQEVVAVELLRIIVGSIGLIMAVPATTAVAAWFFHSREVDEEDDSSHHGHHHH